MTFIWALFSIALGFSIYFFARWILKGGQKPLTIFGYLLTLAMGFFAASWCISSFEEIEIRSVGMGALFFGGATIVLFVLTRRYQQKFLKAKH